VIDLAAERLLAARSVCVLTGAGMSAESGLPTFRGANGLWRTHRVEDLASPEGFARDPELVWTWYDERRFAHAHAVPNAGHYALAELARVHRHVVIATQNVDSLHHRAGSRGVLELHGHLREARCNGCGARTALDDSPMTPQRVAHACGGLFRPDIVWFGESLPDAVWQRALSAARAADTILVVGTSGLVNPAAMLATHIPQEDAFIIEVNPDETAITAYADVHLPDTAARSLPQLLEAVRRMAEMNR
jgi:NAD-dependent deacetylase